MRIDNSQHSPTSISWQPLPLALHQLWCSQDTSTNWFSSLIHQKKMAELGWWAEPVHGGLCWAPELVQGVGWERSEAFGGGEPLAWLGCVWSSSRELRYEIVAQMVWLPANDNSSVCLIKILFQKHCWRWYKLAWLQSMCHLSGRLWNALAKLACVSRLCLDHIDPNGNPSY